MDSINFIIMKKLLNISLLCFIISYSSYLPNTNAQEIPGVLSQFQKDSEGNLYIMAGTGEKLIVSPDRNGYTFSQMRGNPIGTEKGIDLDFQRKTLNGMIYYGLINYNDSKYPMPVYRSSPARIISGKASVDFNQLRGIFDMTGWQESGKGTIGYRVIDKVGNIIYDGKVSFNGTGPFKVVNSIISGPFVHLSDHESKIISFETSEKSICEVEVDGIVFKDKKADFRHEIKISGLKSDTRYAYKVRYGELEQNYSFNTSPVPGTRKKFLFGYSSDSRGGSGWGERNLYGANAYIIKKIMAVGARHEIAFMQFTGDLIGGYGTNRDNMLLQYHNWKNAVAPFGHHFPVIPGMGNHEAYNIVLEDSAKIYKIAIDKFPYKTESAEALFASVVVNPHNGPQSEDGSKYDPNPKNIDFPSYDENVFHYTYDNVAIINLNSNYWYTPSIGSVAVIGGNIHGYVMDNQLKWFRKTLKMYESNKNIDHIFVTIHTPFFPNGGHVHDDMWYNGDNSYRPWIAGQKVDKGIIERRDQLLNLAINQSNKVVAFLTGDEHNYCKTEIGPETIIYPEGYKGKKTKLKRKVYQINNGAAGAPYYAQQETPWTPFTSGFTTQNAVCLFTVEGGKVTMVVINPDTLEEIDQLVLR